MSVLSISKNLFASDIRKVLPVLFDDIQTRMDAWGREGVVDPFKRADDVSFVSHTSYLSI